MQTYIFLPTKRAFHTAIDSFSSLIAHATQCTWPLGDVVFQEVDACVGAFPQVAGGDVGHAGGFLVVVSHRVIHEGIRVSELFQCSVICMHRKHIVKLWWENGSVTTAPALKGFP